MKINLRKDSYDIIFGKDLFSKIARDLNPNFRYAIITDSNILNIKNHCFNLFG